MGWFKSLIGRLSNAGTLAMLGYEVGTHKGDDHNDHIEKNENHNTVIVVSGIVLIIGILAAMITKIILAKRRIV